VTELLYLADGDAAYTQRFEARVVALPPGAIVLDRTFFYPTGGGQPADAGRLFRAKGGGSWPVVDVQRAAGAVLHRLGRPEENPKPLQLDEPLQGEIDWERRYRHMRLHTGQHLLSARLFAMTGRRTRGARFSGTGGTIDLEFGLGELPAASEIERDVRRWIEENRAVRTRLVPLAEYATEPPSRSAAVGVPPGIDPVRVVEIDAADRCPCGGTHVRSLGEVGGLQVHPPELRAGGEARISFRLTGALPPTPPG
ncbi:MAG: alanyl-tRNA editing protein, partial [Thermoplasmata archaeon]|nr:alanyl-tRNA editing protein [Thermoplasmata archaeon]